MKAEHAMTKGIAAMIRRMLQKTIDDGLSAQAALKRAMAKILGQRMMCKQETTHLMLSVPMVQCSHDFARINLDDQLRLLNVQNNDNQQNANPSPNDDNNINNVNNNDGNNSNNDSRSNSNNSQISIKSIAEMHGLRMNRRSWLNDQLHEHHISSL